MDQVQSWPVKDVISPKAASEEASEGDDVIDLFDDCSHAHRKRHLESDDAVMS